MDKQPQFNEHGKKEYPPMHTVEHVINGAMVKLFDSGRSLKAHIERKKSRMDFRLERTPTDADLQALEDEVNRVLALDLPVTFEVMTQAEAAKVGVDLTRIPEDATDLVQIARVGDYDACLCIGDHVEHTSQCGRVDFYSHDYDAAQKRWRIRYKLVGEDPIYAE